MKDFVALYINNKLGIGIASLYPQLLQNILQAAYDFRAASNWQRVVDGFKFLLMIKIGYL